MILGHTYKEENGKQILILHLDYNYEFGKTKKEDKPLIDKINEYIKKNKLWISSGIIILAVGTLAIARIKIDEHPLQNEANHQYITDKLVVELVDYELKTEDKTEKEEQPKPNDQEEKKDTNKTPTPNKNQTTTPSSKPNIKPQTPSTTPIESTPTQTPTIPEEKPIYSGPTVTVYRNRGDVITLPLEEYLIGVTAAEMPASFHIEALKAQAIVARTYTLRHLAEGKTFTDDERTQVYYDIEEMKREWGSSFSTYYQKIKNAVEATKDLKIYYQGTLIDAVYHSTNNGYTINAKDVWGYDIPYLKSVASSWDLESRFYYKKIEKDTGSILNMFGETEGTVEVITRNDQGYVMTVKVGNQIVSGKDFRSKCGLASTDFTITENEGILTIETKGWGHSVGMSQFGANGMAKNGYTYNQILTHYYQNVTIR